MLQKNPNNRISAEEALNHNWFKKFPDENKLLNQMASPMIEGSRGVRNMFVQNQKIEESNQDIEMNEDDAKNGTPQTPVGEGLLMTSHPIMNMKLQKNLVAGMNSEKDKLSTFQTPLPQMRFANRGQGVDSRLSKLLGAQKGNLSGDVEVIEEQKEEKKGVIGFSNNLADKLNQIQKNQNKGGNSLQLAKDTKITNEQLGKKWYMTPNVQMREVSEENVNNNRAKLIGMTGGGTGGQDSAYKGNKNNFEQIDSVR